MAKPDPKALASAVSSVDQGGSGTGSLYGLPSDEQALKFSVDGLPGLNGQLSGKQFLDLFLAAGTDPGLQPLAAAIQQALAYGGYYTSGVPTLGHVTSKDAEALGRALHDLAQRNQAQGSASPSGQVKGMGVAQFLGAQAALGAAYGPTAAQAAPTVVNLRAPNPADVASTYMKVAQQITGKKPDPQQVAAFVDNYTQSFLSNERQNAQAQYEASVQKATVTATAKQQLQYAPQQPVSSPQSNFIQSEIDNINNPNAGNPPQNVVQRNDLRNQGNPQQTDGPPAPQPGLSDELQTIQDVINANTQQGAQSDPGMIFAGTNASESPSVAAENFARNQNPHAAAATDLSNTFNTFLSLVGKNFGG